MKVTKLQEGDSGQYVCVANNAAGTTKHEFQVTVLSPPFLTHHPLTNYTGDLLFLLQLILFGHSTSQIINLSLNIHGIDVPGCHYLQGVAYILLSDNLGYSWDFLCCHCISRCSLVFSTSALPFSPPSTTAFFYSSVVVKSFYSFCNICSVIKDSQRVSFSYINTQAFLTEAADFPRFLPFSVFLLHNCCKCWEKTVNK